MSRSTLRKLLFEELALLIQSTGVLKYSFELCREIGIKPDYNNTELIDFESLCSRFARSSDILTQKVIKTLFMYRQDDCEFFIDRCNLCEKLNLVNNADELKNIRDLRNDIAHEYCISDITTIFKPVLEYTELLLNIVSTIENYIKEDI